MSLVLTLEEIAAGDGATSTIVSVQNSLPCGILNRFGSDAQKEAWLKPLARGEKLGCFCLTEPHVARTPRRSAPARARRQRVGAQRRQAVHHHRQNTPMSPSCSRSPTRPPARRHHLLPGAGQCARLPGGPHRGEKMGQKASDTTQILFEDCRIPADSVVGKEGEGYRIALSNLEAGRIGIAAQCRGHGACGAGGCGQVRPGARELRQADLRAPGGQLPPRRHGHATRGRAPARVPRRQPEGRRPPLPQGGLDGQTVRLRDGRARARTPSRCTAAMATSPTSRSSASTATCACARSTKAPATSRSW